MITIDGPAGAGKSTVAREVARRLGFRLVDTGALYRALAWAVARAGVATTDAGALRALLARTTVELVGDRVLVNGQDVTGEIRAPEISMLTSRLTVLPALREKMTPIQQSLAAAGGVVLEGRDTGTVVCPDAEVKIYLDADLSERARRRERELAARGTAADYESVKAEMAERDRQDTERAIAPLRKPADAISVDSTGVSPNTVVQRILDAVEQARCCTRS
ncbi:MAG TPA: (d)CMP kinase [Methylomirabilota bacterium]|nr:(d)CMP kinase [Methylomirabilota bacterium]